MTTIPDQCPVDDHGLLVHEDDAAAQLALAVARLERRLAELGTTPDAVRRLVVRTTDPDLLTGVLDVLTDRLAVLGARPEVLLVEVDRLAPEGALVALDATTHTDIVPTTTHPEDHPMTTTPVSPADTLRGLCQGRVQLPGDPGYDAARTPWNLAADLRPAAVARPHTVEEVADVVRAAAAAGLRVAPQSSGHGAAALAEQPLGDVVLVKLDELTGVSVDPAARTARVLGGTLWQDVVAAAAPHGLTALHGSSPDVAVAGYVLGGGLSFYGRRHGLAANSLRAVELVDASGTLVRASAEENADLFWAVRGGGGSFGVVVALELALLEHADVVAGMLLWDREHAPAVTRAWTAWTRDLPESVTSSLRVMSFPPLPELPPFLSGRQLVVIDGALLEDDGRAAELLAPLRALAPEIDTFARIPASGLLHVHMDPPQPSPAVGDHALLGELPEAAVEAFLGEVGPGTSSALLFAELRHLGGALGRPAPGGGATSHLDAAYALLGVAMAPVPELAAAGRRDARALREAMAPWSTGGLTMNFAETAERPGTVHGARLERLRAIRATVDPRRLFVANHPVD